MNCRWENTFMGHVSLMLWHVIWCMQIIDLTYLFTVALKTLFGLLIHLCYNASLVHRAFFTLKQSVVCAFACVCVSILSLLYGIPFANLWVAFFRIFHWFGFLGHGFLLALLVVFDLMQFNEKLLLTQIFHTVSLSSIFHLFYHLCINHSCRNYSSTFHLSARPMQSYFSNDQMECQWNGMRYPMPGNTQGVLMCMPKKCNSIQCVNHSRKDTNHLHTPIYLRMGFWYDIRNDVMLELWRARTHTQTCKFCKWN